MVLLRALFAAAAIGCLIPVVDALIDPAPRVCRTAAVPVPGLRWYRTAPAWTPPKAMVAQAPVKPPRPSKRIKPSPLLAVRPIAFATAVEPDEAMRMALRKHRGLLERCYEQELKKRASFDGYVVVALSLSAEGKVVRAKLEESSAKDRVVGQCIAARLKSLRLPPLTSDAELEVPIRLEAKLAI